MGCRCRTINLAVESMDKIKKECKISKVQESRPHPRYQCKEYEAMPAPPGRVSKRKIMVCTARPVNFQCPPVPCVCPPCPICPTYGERAMTMSKNGLKLFALYCLVKWTYDLKFWTDGHNGTSRFTLQFIEQNFPSRKPGQAVMANLPSMEIMKYRILSTWDTIFGNFFYYTFGLPLKVIASMKLSGYLNEPEDNAQEVEGDEGKPKDDVTCKCN